MKAVVAAVAALLFAGCASLLIVRPSWSPSAFRATLDEESAEAEVDEGNLRGLTGGGQGYLEAILRNPEDPEDCDDNVCGVVRFYKPADRKKKLNEIMYRITGLEPNQLHALHVHENKVTSDCLSTGGHWNPEKTDHGGNLFEQRHVGDLGNILADEKGIAEGRLLAKTPFRGWRSIRDRAVVVHAGTDDLGLGGDAGSRAVGNAGARPACGNIKVIK